MKRAKKSPGGAPRAARQKMGQKAGGKNRSRAGNPNNDPAGGAFGESISKLFDLQRKMLRAGTAAARSAVDNPASQRVKDGVAESLQGGLRKLEQVFDERVASALDRMGMPSAEALRDLCAKVEALTAAGKTSKAAK
jgi:Poly(hydroxyalcanoate) granule associated protein (phasin)